MQKIWLAMLSQSRPQRNLREIPVDSSREIFSAKDADGRVLQGESSPAPKENTMALINIALSLLQYCGADVRDRSTIAADIEKAASNLLDRVALRSTSKRRNPKSTSSTKPAVTLRKQSISQPTASRKVLDEAIRMLPKEQAQLQYDVKEIPACVLQGLGRWTQTRFVIINWNQSFPPVEDISHTGDGQYRMLFFARLSPDKTLLCFQNNTGVGAAYHGLVFVRQNEACDMMHEFAFAGPVWSMKDLRSAVIENAKYQLERDRLTDERQGRTETSRSEELAPNVEGAVRERSLTASKVVADTRLGSSINDFLLLWGPPAGKESLVRTASLKWNRPAVNGESVVDAYAVKVAFVDGIAYQIALRSKQQMTPSQLVKLTKPFLTTVRNADFVKPVWQVKKLRSYKLSDGTFVSANKHKRGTVVVIKGANYARNEEISAQEAKIR
jgi:hypothetical protein